MLGELPDACGPSSPRCCRSWAARPARRRRHHGQPQLFEALLTLLDQLGREQPFALVLEDIHWADRSTRAFLVFLARSLWAERVLVIATYRSDELHRRHPLRPLLASSSATRAPAGSSSRGSSRDELGACGRPPRRRRRRRLLERLYARSEGNPLSPRSCWPRGSTGAAGCRARCATR